MSLSWSQQLIMAPVVLPLMCGAVLILVNESRHRLKFALNFGAVLLLLAVAVMLMWRADSGDWPGGVGVYLAANWAAPFGIALVADRLAALMLLLTAALAGCALLYSAGRWSRIGVHFHSLFQFMLMGLNGAFLTHDLFNLFVFFEVMLAASYGLLLHGYNAGRIRAGMQFVAINLLASLLFLIGVALIYANTGTLNMADVAARVREMDAAELGLLRTGMTVLLIVFLVKSAMWPFGFWLPTTYAEASPPVAAMFVLMTKVGVYSILRVWLPVFFGGAGDDIGGFGAGLLFWGGIATIVFGAAGMLASEVQNGRLAGYAAIASSGTLLAAIGYGQGSLVPVLLFYLVSSTLAIATFMLLLELIDRGHNPLQAILAVTREAFEFEDTPEQPVGVGIPAAVAFMGLSFAGCALVIAGLPPLSGFIAKFGMLHVVLAGNGTGATATTFVVVMILSGLAAVVALSIYGIRTFWGGGMTPPRINATEVVPIGILLLASVLLTLYAGSVFSYLERTGAGLQQPGIYIERVLSAPVVETAGGARP